ncbi:23S rRNA pseudouridine955/2504/2580 synthase [Lachnobacterium bovis]|uniref:RNA pseudouridylate synthase n=2 Tax=Lachnobacterium bovis TaxID=140626 RepID=A0A1H9QPM7_9FIRM|nr:23S rRNA pseudouridine955/2504/2580 synthase [Lachnobacterium bovis]
MCTKMKEFKISINDKGQRFDKFLFKLLPNANASFVYKMLRKKNITLNNKKANGKEKLTENDVVKVFFSDETFEKFSKDIEKVKKEYEFLSSLKNSNIKIIYQNCDIIIIDKPSNLLSQKAKESDISANEYIIGHLIRNNELSFEDFITFRPSICNRLDRNTTGLLIAGKTLNGLQMMSDKLKNRTIDKYYRCIVVGKVEKNLYLKGYLKKDKLDNTVDIISEEEYIKLQNKNKDISNQYSLIETAFEVVQSNEKYTMIQVHLITGKTHQIRAHLSHIGHPIVGDMKYGNEKENEYAYKKYKVKHQLLHAYCLDLKNEQKIYAPVPKIFNKLMDL